MRFIELKDVLYISRFDYFQDRGHAVVALVDLAHLAHHGHLWNLAHLAHHNHLSGLEDLAHPGHLEDLEDLEVVQDLTSLHHLQSFVNFDHFRDFDL